MFSVAEVGYFLENYENLIQERCEEGDNGFGCSSWSVYSRDMLLPTSQICQIYW